MSWIVLILVIPCDDMPSNANKQDSAKDDLRPKKAVLRALKWLW